MTHKTQMKHIEMIRIRWSSSNNVQLPRSYNLTQISKYDI